MPLKHIPTKVHKYMKLCTLSLYKSTIYEEEVTRHIPLVVHLCIPYLYAVYFMTLAIKWNSEFRNRLMCAKSIETSTVDTLDTERGSTYRRRELKDDKEGGGPC